MKNLMFFLWLFTASAVYAQNIRDYGTSKVRLNEPGKSIVMEILPTTEPELQSDRLYYWFSGNLIHTTQGGYSGKLLNGTYNEYFPGKNIKEQGIFRKGLKNGLWKDWAEDGTLIQQITWKNGVKDGPFTLFDEQGNKKQSGKNSNNLLDGKVLFFHGRDSVEIKTYRAGVLMMPPSPSLWQKIKRFRFIKKKQNVTAVK